MSFVKGQSGNPTGKSPKHDKIWSAALRRAIQRREESDPLALEKLADKLLQAVDDGDVSAMKELADRLDGKPKQEHTGEDGGPLVVNIVKFANGHAAE